MVGNQSLSVRKSTHQWWNKRKGKMEKSSYDFKLYVLGRGSAFFFSKVRQPNQREGLQNLFSNQKVEAFSRHISDYFALLSRSGGEKLVGYELDGATEKVLSLLLLPSF